MVVLAAVAATRLLALGVSFLHAFLRTEWQRFVGTPGMVTGAFLVIPAAWLVFREAFLDAWLAGAGPGTHKAAPKRGATRCPVVRRSSGRAWGARIEACPA